MADRVCGLAAPWTTHVEELTNLTIESESIKLTTRPEAVPETYSYDADYMNDNATLGAWIPPEPSAKRQAIEAPEEEKKPAEVADKAADATELAEGDSVSD